MSKAVNLIQQAEKKAKGHAFSFLSGGPKYDEAADLYKKAGNVYKLEKSWSLAAECFFKASGCHEANDDRISQMQMLTEAYTTANRVSRSEADVYFNLVVRLNNDHGRFAQNAKMYKTQAEQLEKDGDQRGAMVAFKEAARFFEMDDYGKSNYSQCIVQYAQYKAQLDGDVDEAIRIFEKEAEKCLENNLLQFNAKEHFLKAGLLVLSKGDAITASVSYDQYTSLDPRFEQSGEGRLMRGLTEAFEEGDVKKFVEAA
ncbi:MAG: uncharacterized protein KVP18_001375 [Porospora cf. gigantea A]|uniref:uncharacterized protein n=1 Tax=Porospora cf. gigantea A TaxID=2853593 RepID=UPI00355AA827|nr:MAG: hypothetical protein KVP18_001375 [Porospora cf. gigantea A]